MSNASSVAQAKGSSSRSEDVEALAPIVIGAAIGIAAAIDPVGTAIVAVSMGAKVVGNIIEDKPPGDGVATAGIVGVAVDAARIILGVK